MRDNSHYFSLEQQPMASKALRGAIELAEKFPESLDVPWLSKGEWRQLIPFIEQNHNLQKLELYSEFLRKSVLTLHSVSLG